MYSTPPSPDCASPQMYMKRIEEAETRRQQLEKQNMDRLQAHDRHCEEVRKRKTECATSSESQS